MKKEINMGIGFVTGRSNVCNVINSYYEQVLNQFKDEEYEIKLHFFILYDLSYQYTTREDFYNLLPEVYKENIFIKYITPENIQEQKKMLMTRDGLTQEEVDLFLGHGHARGRNTVLYYALKYNMDYLLFWDDDEYPIANLKNENGTITWKKQNNIQVHLKYIDDADITIGYHCGYISPIPYIDCTTIGEENFKNYIEAISNDIISWDSIKEKFQKNNGITYADSLIANGEQPYELGVNGEKKWVSGSTLCINMKNIKNIPAFYNPPEARGEDTFFSIGLDESKVIKVPVYHFHDGFLKYTSLMEESYPQRLRKIKTTETQIEDRFLNASKGWIKYKPLLMYILDKNNYKSNVKDMYKKLKTSIPLINSLFETSKFDILLKELEEYDKNVEKHYKEYLQTNEIWKKIKEKNGIK